jgi:predicted AlkP superfamily phosphohydrolase/phosphomutase
MKRHRMKRHRVVYAALDATDPSIVRQLAATGRMPTLARLFERAAHCKVRNPFGMFVSSLWINFATACRTDTHGYHCWDEIDVNSYERRMTTPLGAETRTFWRSLSDAGRSVAVIDVPHSCAGAAIDGIQVAEWGAHDRHFGFHSWPPKKAGEIEAQFGLHPLFGMDAHRPHQFAPDDYAHREAPLRTQEEDIVLFDSLTRGVGAKRKLNAALKAERDWDLFLTVLGEGHAIGHQQWHLHDSTHPRFDPQMVRVLGGDPVEHIYCEMDAALANLLDSVDNDTTVMVHLSHGMGPHYDGCHLLDEVLHRLELLHQAPSHLSGKELIKRAARVLPGATQRRFFALAAPVLREAAERRTFPPCPEFVTAQDRAKQRYFLAPNNYYQGGVRLNLSGREPKGLVRTEEVDQLCKELRNDLMALVNVATGGPVINNVVRLDRWFARSVTDTFPDLLVDWERTAQIETVWSPKIGLVHAPYTHWRTGDHRPGGVLLAYGPDIPAGATLPTLAMEDIGASIAARLGVRLDDVDGAAANWLGAL